MDPRRNCFIEYDEFMKRFVTAGLAKDTDKDDIEALLKEIKPIIDGMDFASFGAEEDMYPHLCMLFNSVIDFVRRRDPEGVVHDLRARITSQHREAISIHDTRVNLSFYDMARTPRDALSTDSKHSTKSSTSKPVSPPNPASAGNPPGAAHPHESQRDGPSAFPASKSHDEPQASNPQTGNHSNAPSSVEANLVSRCLWDFIRMFVEVKFSVDPYSFARGSPDRFSEAKDAEYDRGQIAEYAGECLERQHRLSLYSLYIYRDHFSIQLWDRNGMLMSTSTNYKQDPMSIVRFLYYFVKMTDEQVGYDPTVKMVEADSEPVLRMKAKVKDDTFRTYPDYVQERVKEAMKVVLDPEAFSDGEVQTPLYKAAVPIAHAGPALESPRDKEDDGPDQQNFLIGRRLSSSGAEPYGRGTKGFVAFDLQSETFVFLKDAWRESSANPEASTYRILKEKNVPNIATLVCGGDIPGHCTKTHAFLDKFKQPMYHHRLVLKEIGLPLEKYVSSQHLCTHLWKALIAHQKAYEDARILHRDISENNIIIWKRRNAQGKEVPEVLLIDWDLSKTRDQLERNEFSDGNRSGTWLYLSAPRLAYPGKPWELADDLESFVHLLNLFAVRFHPHRIAPSSLPAFLYDRYQTCHYDPTTKAFWGCSQKIQDVETGSCGFKLQLNPQTGRPTNLARLIGKLMMLCKDNWNSLDHQALEKHAVPNSLEFPFSLGGLSDLHGSDSESDDSELLTPPTTNDSDHDVQQYPVAPRKQSPFNTHSKIIDVFKEALGWNGWLKKDKTPIDQLGNLDRRVVTIVNDTRSLRLAPANVFAGGRSSKRSATTSVTRKKNSTTRGKKSSSRDAFHLGSNNRNASSRSGSKRKATLVEDNFEPEFEQGSSTNVLSGASGSRRSHGSKRSRLQ